MPNLLPRAVRNNEPEDPRAYQVLTMEDAIRVAKMRDQAMDEGLLPSLFDENDPDPYGYLSELEQEMGIQLQDAQWTATPDEPLWQKRIRARGRKAMVSKLFLQGYRVPMIAEQLRCSETTVVRDLQRVQLEWRHSYLGDMETIAATDMQRLEYYLLQLAAGIERGDVKSINSAVEIIKERGNILGYRQGMSVDIEQYIREVAESNGFDPDRAVQIASKVSFSFRG